VINNVGLCFEHLGKLKKAKRFFEESERLSLRTGHIGIRIVSLSNVACVAAKLGDMVVAQKHYSGALGRIDDLRAARQEFDETSFMSVYADIALYYKHVGNFERMFHFLQRIQPGKGWLQAVNRIFCALIKAELLGHVGEKKLADSILSSLQKYPSFSAAFFRVARSLVEARINRNSPERMLSTLSECFALSDESGASYQQCEVLNEMAKLCLDLNNESQAIHYAKRALGAARRNRYRLLGARALLLAGRSADIPVQKQR